MTTTDTAVRTSVLVEAPLERTFAVFTEEMGRWWLPSHHIGAAELRDVVVEPREGGRWYEIGTDANECDWGYVLEWEPPNRLLLAWQLDASWQFDPNLVTEVEVRFTPEGPDETRVELEHRNLDRFGDAQERMRTSIDSPDGWRGLLAAFALAVV